MEFNSYQKEALRTDRVPASDGPDATVSLIVPMLGLASETGELLSEYKKHLRDGEAHHLFKERVSEELGDLLWYIANVASKFGLTLDEVAAANLAKVKERWSAVHAEALSFDAGLPEGERLPRQFEVELIDVGSEERHRVRVIVNGKLVGAELTDNATASTISFTLRMRRSWAGRQSRAPCFVESARVGPSWTRSRMGDGRP
jgi:NTP pyrophosphatase (non-canonical NTP hydrolase)